MKSPSPSPSIVLAVCSLPLTLFSQGNLTPPLGAPAASMRTLEQIEPRTPLPKSPLAPVAGPHYIIGESGSYYLTGNIEVASGNGINITASHVSLDLNGFCLISKTVSPAAGNAIDIAPNLHSIEIKNGTITGGALRTPSAVPGAKPWEADYADMGWSSGINDVNASPSRGARVSYLTVQQCKSDGIDLQGPSVLSHIHAHNNGRIGIYAFHGSVDNSIANYNGNVGIVAGNCSLANVTASYNRSGGINASKGSITNSTASSNGGNGISAELGSVTNATASSNGLDGIYAPSGSVANGSASANSGSGIYVSGGCVTNSRASSNFQYGIFVSVGVAAHCLASNNSTDPATTSENIFVNIPLGGQRVACVPATE